MLIPYTAKLLPQPQVVVALGLLIYHWRRLLWPSQRIGYHATYDHWCYPVIAIVPVMMVVVILSVITVLSLCGNGNS